MNGHPLSWRQISLLLALAWCIAPQGHAVELRVHQPVAGPVDTFLGRLGSRAAIHARPALGQLKLLPLGTFAPGAADLVITVTDGTHEWRAGVGEQALDFGALHFSSASAIPDIEAVVELLAPFEPGNWELSELPAFFLRIAVKNTGTVHRTARVAVRLRSLPAAGALVADGEFTAVRWSWEQRIGHADVLGNADNIGLPRRYFGLRPENAAPPKLEVKGKVEVWLVAEAEGWNCDGDGLQQSLELSAGSAWNGEAVATCWTASPALVYRQTPVNFRYLSRWPSPESLARGAWRARSRAWESAAALSDSLRLPGIPEPAVGLACHALQSYLANTWAASLPDGGLLYSVWEGHPRFHSTLDVEINNAPFYLLFWPELLPPLFDRWAEFPEDGAPPHDTGQGLYIGGQAYPVQMRVEEICNYALLHFLYWKYTGDDGPMLRHFRFLAEQVLNLLRADTDGNGYPDLGVANTLDDAPAAVHSAANGTYLGLKTYAAARAVEAMAIRANRLPVAKKCQRLQERIERTLRSSWLDGRYPVHLPGSSPAAGAVMHAGVIGDERAGDAVSYDGGAIYGPLGLLPLLLTGIDLPDEPDRLLADLRAQRQLTLTKYGSAHSTGMTNVWVSQNLVRDTIGMYLSGADEWFQDAPRYWQLQLDLAQRAQGEPELAGYTDSPVNPVLTSYSRGGAVFGYWLAAAGLTCDAQAGVVGYSTPDTAAPWPLWFLRKQGAALPLLVTGADGARKLTGELKFPARAEPAPAPRAAASAGEREAPVSGGSDGGER